MRCSKLLGALDWQAKRKKLRGGWGTERAIDKEKRGPRYACPRTKRSRRTASTIIQKNRGEREHSSRHTRCEGGRPREENPDSNGLLAESRERRGAQ